MGQFNYDPFSEFQGKLLNNESVQSTDIFSHFGGKSLDVNPIKQFVSDYMESPIYKKRLQNFGVKDAPDISNVRDTHVTSINGPGSQASDKYISENINTDTNGYPVKKGVSNINIDQSQLGQINKQYNVNEDINGVTAHEFSHISRQLTPQEEDFIASMNKQKVSADLFKDFKKSAPIYDSKTLKPVGFSEYLSSMYNKNPDVHDSAPNEIKADLDALRYSLFKKGIYDTSKRDMTINDFNKASKNPEIKNSLEYKRLIDRFKPTDIVKMNNTLASIGIPEENTNA